jgi:hypothetical protein
MVKVLKWVPQEKRSTGPAETGLERRCEGRNGSKDRAKECCYRRVENRGGETAVE